MERYYNEHGQHLPSKVNLIGYAKRLMAELGATTRFHDIDEGQIKKFIGAMRSSTWGTRTKKPYGPRTINAHLNHFRTVALYLQRRAKVPDNIPWGKLKLGEPKPSRPIIETEHQVRDMLGKLDPDLRALALFSLALGQRQANSYLLEKGPRPGCRAWLELDGAVPQAIFMRKSKTPGGEPHPVPLSPAILKLLEPLMGDHATRVFTYRCRRTFHERDPETGELTKRIEGERYPMTKTVLRDRWMEYRKASGNLGLNWHRLRASAMVRLFRQTRDLGQVMKISGHRDAETAMGYLRNTTDLPAVRATLEADPLLLTLVSDQGKTSGKTQLRHSHPSESLNVPAPFLQERPESHSKIG